MTIPAAVPPSSFSCFNDVRAHAAAFCVARSWEKFHLPVSLMMALSGECGELNEIFQWKFEGSGQALTEKELVNVGEEISDVCIYAIRLAEISHIDLALSVRHVLGSIEAESYDFKGFDFLCIPPNAWDSLTFAEVAQVVDKHSTATATTKSSSPPLKSRHLLSRSDLCHMSNNPRKICLGINHFAGRASALFALQNEGSCQVGLAQWSRNDVSELAFSLASICILLSLLARNFSYQVGTIVYSKFEKNAAKYPVHLVKGSSAKYTEYADKIKRQAYAVDTSTVLLVVVAFVLGAAFKTRF